MYQFTNSWFESGARSTWEKLIPHFAPANILEIGCFEGASTCWLIETLGNIHKTSIYCIDSWEGGVEHNKDGAFATSMSEVEDRFKSNIGIALERASHLVEVTVEKDFSDIACANLLVGGKRNFFDFIYIDGSHQAPDVLFDAAICFKLLKIGGLMVFDDYLWRESLPGGVDLLRCPKIAIDSFININIRKISLLPLPTNQIFLIKTAD